MVLSQLPGKEGMSKNEFPLKKQDLMVKSPLLASTYRLVGGCEQ